MSEDILKLANECGLHIPMNTIYTEWYAKLEKFAAAHAEQKDKRIAELEEALRFASDITEGEYHRIEKALANKSNRNDGGRTITASIEI